MHAVVLVGGFGTRLRPLTNSIPKPMLPVGNVPLLARLLTGLERGGVTDATLALGFQPEPFLAAFPDQRCGGVRLHYAVEPEPLDTGGAIRFAAEHRGIDSTFVVANGDILTDVDVADLVASHEASDAAATLHLIAVADPSAYGVADVAADGRITRFVEKPAPGTAPSDLVNAGTYVFDRSVLDLIPPGRRVSIERDTFPRLAAAGRLFGAARDTYWLDAGRPEQYLQANLDLLDGKRRDQVVDPVAPGAVVAADARLERSLVGAGASVGSATVLTNTVVLPGARVGDRATLVDSIVMGTVGDGARLRRVVLGAEGNVAAHASVADALIPDPNTPTLPLDAPEPEAAPAAGVEADEPATEDVADADIDASTDADIDASIDVEATAEGEGGHEAVEHRRPVLVIGGAGFLGSHLVDRLLADGAAIEVVDDLSTGSLAALADARDAVRGGGDGTLHIHTLDATTPAFAELVALRRPATIYHLALLGEHGASDAAHGRAFQSMLGVLEAARQAGVAKIVVALPATAMYGQPASRDLPAKEGPLVARGVRGVVANAIVELLGVYRERWDIEFTALAVATVYGPRQRRGLVAAALAAATAGQALRLDGDGRQTRDLVYVDDAVDALAKAGDRGSGLVINVGTGVQTSIRDLWDLVAPDGPPAVHGPARVDELVRFAVSPVRARIHLGWASWTPVDEGIAGLRA